MTTLGVGGAARWFDSARSAAAARQALAWAGERHLPVFVLGGGSNLVVADEGWPGLVLQVSVSGITGTPDGDDVCLTAGAGGRWDALVEHAVAAGLAGLECLSGIPGTVGGTPVQNVGAYGQEVGDVIDRVDVLDRATGGEQSMSAAACGFGYRMSRFKAADRDRFIVSSVTFRLRRDTPTIAYPDVIAYLKQHAIMAATVRDVRGAVLAIRRRKGMVLDAGDPDTRSVGSFFMNPVVPATTHAALAELAKTAVPSFPAGEGLCKVPAAWLIEHAGFTRGFTAGAAGVSTKHPLALVNLGGASARDIVALAVRIKRQVADRFGIDLRTEPIFVGFGDDPDVAYLNGARG
jgi:UDP-N-acetylmuramate dehydrogenase